MVFLRLIFIVLIFFSSNFLIQNSVNAQDDGGAFTGVDDDGGAFTGVDDDGGANRGGGGSVSILNPLGEGSTITSFFLQIIEIILIFAVPIIVLFIIISGFRMVTAQGDTNQLTESKRAFIYAIIGGLLILGAFVILDVIQGTVDSFIQ